MYLLESQPEEKKELLFSCLITTTIITTTPMLSFNSFTSLTFIAIQPARCKTYRFTEVYNCFLYPAHVPKSSSFQQQSLNTITIKLDSFGS